LIGPVLRVHIFRFSPERGFLRCGRFNDLAASEMLIRESSFNEVPAGVVHESLLGPAKQKNRRMRSAARRVRAMAS
jgi:hypothetical protein